MKQLAWFSLAIFFIFACNRTGSQGPGQLSMDDHSYAKYASGFNLTDYDLFKLLQVYDPWQNSR